MPSIHFLVALTLLAGAGGLTFIRFATGPSLPDRVIAIDLIGVLMVWLLVVMAGMSAQQAFLDVAMVVALISFVGTVALRAVHRTGGIMIAWLSGGLFIAGAILGLLAAVGVLRMPDVFTRMQASTKASTLGLGCLLAGVALRNPELSFAVRAASIAAFMLLTTAVSAHVIARAAARSGAPLRTGTMVDERPGRVTGQDPL